MLAAALPGRRIPVPTVDPLGRPVEGEILLSGPTAYVESAQACGLHLLTPAEREGSADGYTRHTLHTEATFSISAVVWRPGQVTEIHDHLVWCGPAHALLPDGSDRGSRKRTADSTSSACTNACGRFPRSCRWTT